METPVSLLCSELANNATPAPPKRPPGWRAPPTNRECGVLSAAAALPAPPFLFTLSLLQMHIGLSRLRETFNHAGQCRICAVADGVFSGIEIHAEAAHGVCLDRSTGAFGVFQSK